jgi:DNA-binding NarL/FixJ family response regulator
MNHGARSIGTTTPEQHSWRLPILILEHDPDRLRPTAERVERAGWPVLRAATTQEAIDALNERCGGLIVEIRPRDGSGFDLINAALSLQSHAPVLILTSTLDRDDSNRAQALHADYVCKPLEGSNLRAFLERCRQAGMLPATLVNNASAQYRLTPKERPVLASALVSSRREAIAKALDLAESTVKTHIASVLRKSGAASLEELVVPIRMVVLAR